MNLSAYIKQQGISVYSLSKKSAVPYTTLCSICNGTADVMECRVNTLVKIADSLGVNLLDLILLRKYLAKWDVNLGPQE